MTRRDCYTCRHVLGVTVAIGSRRVVAYCGHPLWPLLLCNGEKIQVENMLYADDGRCVRYEPHQHAQAKLGGYQRGIAFRNAELTEEYA